MRAPGHQDSSSSGRQAGRNRSRGRLSHRGRGREYEAVSWEHQGGETSGQGNSGYVGADQQSTARPQYSTLRGGQEEATRGGRSSRRGHRWQAAGPPRNQILNPNAHDFQPGPTWQQQQANWQPRYMPQQQDAWAPRHRPPRNTQAPAGRGSVSTPEPEDTLEYPACVICCDDLKVVTVGKCNHKDICAICSLRMRLCYQKEDCPLCKAELKEVVLTPWRPGGVPDWSQLLREMPRMWTNLSWVRGVFVDVRRVEGISRSKRPLSAELEARTGKMCTVCDPSGDRLFPSNRSLMRHMENEHDRHLCTTCIAAHRQFPAELEVHTKQSLDQHMGTHPWCEFCKTYHFGPDELYQHMRTAHFMCYVCQQLGRFAYFQSPETYSVHLSLEHFMCHEMDCLDCFVAFATPQELAQHRQNVHMRGRGNSMPTRRLQLAPPIPDIQLPRGPRGREQPQRGQGSLTPGRRLGRGAGVREGIRMIDDNVGLSGEPFPAADEQHHFEHAGTSGEELPVAEGADRLPESSTLRQADGVEQQPGGFPDLASQGLQPLTRSQAGHRPREPPQRLPRLVSVTRKCPCGRRSDHPVVPEGSNPGQLACNASCERQNRREQLANAFDIPDPDRHRPVLERTKLVTHTPELLSYAWHNRRWVEDVEHVMVAFVESAAQRHSLPPMQKCQRKVVHEMAAAFGLTTQSFGVEPNRHLQLFKGEDTAIPRNLLSKTAASMTAEEIANALAARQGHALHLTDVAPGLDLHHLFARWEGECMLKGPDSEGRAVVRFASEQGLKEAIAAFGGGLRGSFLIERRPLRAAGRPSQSGARPRDNQTLHQQAAPAGPSSTANGHGEVSWQPVVRSGQADSSVGYPHQQTQSSPSQAETVHPYMVLSEAADPLENWEDLHVACESAESR